MSNPQQVGSFIPSSNIWDVSQIYQVDDISPQLKELLVRMYQNLNLMAINVNLKDTGYYDTLEFIDSCLWFPNPAYNSSTQTAPTWRQESRKAIYITSLPPGTTTVAHNITITAMTTFTKNINGMANDTVGNNYYPISASGTDVDISATLNATNLVLVNNTAITFNFTYVTLHWIQN